MKYKPVDRSKGTHSGSKPVIGVSFGYDRKSADYYRDLLRPELREKLENGRKEPNKDS